MGNSVRLWKEKKTRPRVDNNYVESWLPKISDDTTQKFKLIVDAALEHNFPDGMTKKEIGFRLGYSQTRIRNIINEYGRTSNRDVIIAICLLLKLTSYTTSLCLKYYNLPIFNEADERDKAIIDAIDKGMDIDLLNKQLVNNQMDRLDIKLVDNNMLSSTKKKGSTTSKCKCITLLEDIYCFDSATFFGFNGLSMLYSPDSLWAEASALVKKTDSSHVYELKTDGTTFFIYDDSPSLHPSNSFKLLTDCPDTDFSSKFFELKKKLNKRIEDTKAIFNDTRNYKIRYDCRIERGLMKIYIETFEPIRNIYYQMTKIGNAYEMTVTNDSRFLRYHIGDGLYKDCKYPIIDLPPLLKFTNIHDIEEQELNQRNLEGPIYKIPLKAMKSMYEYLQSQIDRLICDIMDKKICIFDISALDDFYLDPACIFNIDSYFEWSYCEEDPSCSIPNTYVYELRLLDGRTRFIDFDLMRRSIEIGIDDIENLRIILTKYNTLDEFLVSQRNS